MFGMLVIVFRLYHVSGTFFVARTGKIALAALLRVLIAGRSHGRRPYGFC